MATFFDAQITFCYTSDLDRTAAFYEQVMGLPLALDQGGCRIYQTAPAAYIGFCSRPDAPRPEGVILTLVTDDVDGWCERVRSQDAPPVKGPTANTQFQIYHCFIEDPNGYTIEIQKFTDPRWEAARRALPPAAAAPVAENSENAAAEDPIAAILAAARAGGLLKRLDRAGWVEHQVPAPESVAGHSYRAALLALLTAGHLSRERLMAMALLHDLCEAVTGDVTPADRMDPGEKRRSEQAAMAKLTAGLPGGPELMELWLDFELGRTEEGRLMKQIDKLEMALQALEYAELGHPGLDEFLEDGRQTILDPLLRDLFQRIDRQFPVGKSV